jgi:GTP-binding protein EngB required for normal cell division
MKQWKCQHFSRYCISCEDENRPARETEELFFSNLKDIAGDIPVFVIFTKFDKIINAFSEDWMRKHFEDIATGRFEPTTVISAVQRSSIDHFEEMKKKHWEKIVSGNGIKVLRVSNPSKADYGGDISDILSKSKPF